MSKTKRKTTSGTDDLIKATADFHAVEKITDHAVKITDLHAVEKITENYRKLQKKLMRKNDVFTINMLFKFTKKKTFTS